MLVDVNPSGVDVAIEIAGLLSYLGTPNAKTFIDTVVSADIGQPVNSFVGYLPESCPNFYAAQCGTVTVILVGPTANLVQAVGLMNGYAPIGIFRGWTGNNPFIQQAAAYITAQMAANHFHPVQQMFFAGFSLGGAIAESLAAAFAVSAGVQPSWMSFGAPRPGFRSMATQIGSGFGARYMSNGDPIPHFPPRVEDMPQGPTVFGVAAFLGFEYFVHPAGGLLLSDAGSIPVAAETPPADTFLSVTSFPAFLLSQVTGTSTPHNLAHYQTLLRAWALATPATRIERPRPAGIEPANPPAKRDLDRQERAVARAVALQGQAQDAREAVIPPTLAFQAVRVGFQWQVTFNGQVIATGPTKRKARAMARTGNALLKRFGRMAVVDPNGFLNQAGAYMLAAQDPTSGIIPTLNLSWPQVS
jgi:hypothetical protein